MNNYIQNLNWRYATKKFDTSKKIKDEDLNSLLEVLRLSPSSFGLQPWKFIVINNPAIRSKLVGSAYGQTQVNEASHLIVMCAKKSLSEFDVDKYVNDVSSKKNTPIENLAGLKDIIMGTVKGQTADQTENWNKKQVYLALGFVMSALAQMNIDSCPMEGFDPAKVDEILELSKDGLTATLLLPIGYRSDDDKYSPAAKIRFDKADIIEIRD